METVTNEKDYIVSHILGYSLVTADSAAHAWARWLDDDCMDAGNDKEELRNWLIDNGWKTLKTTNLDNVYQIVK